MALRHECNLSRRALRRAVSRSILLDVRVVPVAYPSSLGTAKWQWLYGLNPMAGVIEGFRLVPRGSWHAPWDD